jgi:hypothetical protein
MAGDCNVHCNCDSCNCDSILTQRALRDYTVKLRLHSQIESDSFRILLSARHSSFEPFDAVKDAVSSQQSAVMTDQQSAV